MGATILYYIGLFFYSKKRNARPAKKQSSVSNSDMLDTLIVDSDWTEVNANEIAPQSEKLESVATSSVPPITKPTSFDIPPSVYQTEAVSTKVEAVKNEVPISIDSINEMESADFMFQAFEQSMESSIAKTHDIGMTDLLATLSKTSHQKKQLDEAFINEAIAQTEVISQTKNAL